MVGCLNGRRALMAGAVMAVCAMPFSAQGGEVPGEAAGTAVPQETARPGTAALPVAESAEPLPIAPQFVKPFTAVESGRNDSNPVWSPSGAFLSFERSIGDKKELHVARHDGTAFQVVYHQLSGGEGKEMKFFFPGIVEEVSYNAGITWAPDETRFVFMSNGGEGNYDLYLAELGGKVVTRLTDHKEKDGQPHWSKLGGGVIFTSGRTAKGDIYRIDPDSKALTRITRGDREYLYPQWSPDGKRIALIGGSNENHDIYVIMDAARPAETMVALTSWPHDDIRPVWSPDGRKIAFYTNYNADADPRVWSIVVVPADGSGPRNGMELAAKVVAVDVVPDVERGPAWMPDSTRIVYVKDDRHEYNPLYIADTARGSVTRVASETKMNHDVSCSPNGTIAFRAQINQWDQIFVMRLKDAQPEIR